MRFADVIGQREACKRLLKQVSEDRVPHAQLICGPDGCGKFALALAYASYLLCRNPQEHDICGVCPSCVKTRILEHPDLHFIFPTVRKITCAKLYPEWRAMVARSPYFTLDTWLEEMGAENQQAVIYQQESDSIIQELMLHSSEGGRKVVIIWLPERMNETMANKILKILEEPPRGTVFLLVCNEPELLLPTIVSRTQRFDVPPISTDDLCSVIENVHGVGAEQATRMAHQARGSYAAVLGMLQTSRDQQMFFDEFKLLMRNAYARKIKDLLDWSTQIAGWGREKQKNFLAYALRLVRENFIYNFRVPQLNFMNDDESTFASAFARFVNERNVIPLATELEKASRSIAGNANAQIVFFDFAMKVIILLRK